MAVAMIAGWLTWLYETMMAAVTAFFFPASNFHRIFAASASYDCKLRAFAASYFVQAGDSKISEINYGGKAIFPPSVLKHMLYLNNQSPVMLFKLINPSTDHQHLTHCGVLEFSAEEGCCYLPQWIMTQLGLKDGEDVRIESCKLAKATYAKLKPQSLDFLHITNPRAMLEMEFRKWTCLTKNDRIQMMYNNQLVEFVVQDLKPGNAVCIIECDVSLEFDAPVGYQEPSKFKQGTPSIKPPAPVLTTPTTTFNAFSGGGMRLNGKTSSPELLISQGQQREEIVPEPCCMTDYKPGQLSFIRYDYKCREAQLKEKSEREKADSAVAQLFTGTASTLRKSRS